LSFSFLFYEKLVLQNNLREEEPEYRVNMPTIPLAVLISIANFAESSWKYCAPNENVPKGRSIALCMGAQFYVGSACKRHPLNNIRYTSSKYCPICEEERRLGIM
jgi:hypothetical protein